MVSEFDDDSGACWSVLTMEEHLTTWSIGESYNPLSVIPISFCDFAINSHVGDFSYSSTNNRPYQKPCLGTYGSPGKDDRLNVILTMLLVYRLHSPRMLQFLENVKKTFFNCTLVAKNYPNL
ncbi:hypothetical protein L1887_17999 [Cichorium endivia]|nr:hypothetical protein L1887_17999 [Cichorium endivia]